MGNMQCQVPLLSMAQEQMEQADAIRAAANRHNHAAAR
jgi:hypothetical protein